MCFGCGFCMDNCNETCNEKRYQSGEGESPSIANTLLKWGVDVFGSFSLGFDGKGSRLE